MLANRITSGIREICFTSGEMIMARTLTLLLIIAIPANLWAQDEPAPPPEPAPMERAAFNPCQAVKSLTLFKPIGEIRTQLKDDGRRLPTDCADSFFGQQNAAVPQRYAAPKVFTWQPTNFVHMPVYFDDVPLERYGQTRHALVQPAVSAARFALQIPALPYKMGVNRPHECISTLGHQPPGDCVPCIKQTLPHEADATLLEAAVAVGLVFLLP